MARADRDDWIKCEERHLQDLDDLKTFQLRPRSSIGRRKPLAVRWVYQVKRGPPVKKKVRIVVKGFLQKPGEDFGETFAGVARMESIRILVALSVILDIG